MRARQRTHSRPSPPLEKEKKKWGEIVCRSTRGGLDLLTVYLTIRNPLMHRAKREKKWAILRLYSLSPLPFPKKNIIFCKRNDNFFFSSKLTERSKDERVGPASIDMTLLCCWPWGWVSACRFSVSDFYSACVCWAWSERRGGDGRTIGNEAHARR